MESGGASIVESTPPMGNYSYARARMSSQDSRKRMIGSLRSGVGVTCKWEGVPLSEIPTLSSSCDVTRWLNSCCRYYYSVAIEYIEALPASYNHSKVHHGCLDTERHCYGSK
jgi:hypothetical protein